MKPRSPMTTERQALSASAYFRRQRGQTIVVAIIIMGLLLIIGFVFLGIISHSIKTSATLQNRSLANDLSEAGIRYAHEQMLRSDEGADWHGQPTAFIDNGINTTIDPDANFLRPPANIGGANVLWPGTRLLDRGGPDGLGPYFRVNFQNGRALVRTRYAPSDANVFRSSPTGALRNPGAAKNYIIIESVGREGAVSANDPTLTVTQTPRQVRNYTSVAQFQSELQALAQTEAKFGGIQKNTAFVSIGIVESARFITNKYHVSTPADFGIPDELGAFSHSLALASIPVTGLSLQLGSLSPLLTFDGTNPSIATQPLPFGGSLFSNADLLVHGQVSANLNVSLGDQWSIAGDLLFANGGSLGVNRTQWNNGWNTTPGTLMNGSKSPQFDTAMGAVRDGSSERDLSGIPRGVGRKEPPSIEAVDPQTKANRYVDMTRNSGALVGSANSGEFGFGQGIYVNNFSDVQGGSDENGRTNAGGSGSQVNEWLNPSNTQGSHWSGHYYVPPGAYVQLYNDGFSIARNGSTTNVAERTWRNPDGTDTGSPVARYKIGRPFAGSNQPYIVSQFTPGIVIGNNLGYSDFAKGQPFDGVIYFEGNVRIRGVIPTDLQFSVVSNATIYVEGSITKGILGNQWTSTYSLATDPAATAAGSKLSRPSKSMLILMAKDYVAVNTTQFFGPLGGVDATPYNDVAGTAQWNPVTVPLTQGINLQADFLLDPASSVVNSWNPSNYPAYASEYTSGNTKISTQMLISQTMDPGAGANAFVQLDVDSPGLQQGPNYVFPTAAPYYANAAPFYGAPGTLYGMSTATGYQSYGFFESIALPLIDPNIVRTFPTFLQMPPTAPNGTYHLETLGSTEFSLVPTTVTGISNNNYLLGRFAIVPSEIRIEASMFAEEGSFFIIPGPWFNPNPGDTVDFYNTHPSAGATAAERDDARRQAWGSSPDMPFFGEPIDARIVIDGAISENMPPTAAEQSEWIRRWGWIPATRGTSGAPTPSQHIPANWTQTDYVPNIYFTYDPVLATGRRYGFVDPSSAQNLNDPSTYVRTAWVDYNHDGVQQANELIPLPPLPRLPVSPTLAYFGEVH